MATGTAPSGSLSGPMRGSAAAYPLGADTALTPGTEPEIGAAVLTAGAEVASLRPSAAMPDVAGWPLPGSAAKNSFASRARVASSRIPFAGCARPTSLIGVGVVMVFAYFDIVQYGQSVFRSEEHTSELQSLRHLVCRLL